MYTKKKLLSLAVIASVMGYPAFSANMQEGVTYQSAPEIVQKGEATQNKVTVRLGATSDMHGRLFGYDYAMDKEDSDAGLTRVSSLINDLRQSEPNMILIDIGDTVQGNSAQLFNDMPVHPMVETLNALKYDVWVPGNHEFNFERSFIDRNLQGFNGAVISSNIKWDKNNENYIKAFQVFNVEGVKVAVVGLTPANVPNWEASAPEHFKGLKFEDELKATTEAVDELVTKYHPDVVVGALHMGRTNPNGAGVHDIAAALADKFDVIFAGHEHAKYIEQIVKGNAEGVNISAKAQNRRGKMVQANLKEDKELAGIYNQDNRATKVKIVEPGKWGWALATADIDLEKKDGKWLIRDTSIANISTKKVGEDTAVQEQFAYVDEKAKKDARTSLGKIKGDFIPTATGLADIATGEGVASNGRLYSTIHYAKVHETPLMDFIINLQLQKTGADVSAASLFSDKTILSDGKDYTKGKSTNLYKYDNTLMGVMMSGQNLKAFMEWSYSYFNQYKDGDMTVSFNLTIPSYNYDQFGGNIHYTIDLSKPVGERINIRDIAGVAFDPNKIYKVAVNNYRFGSQVLKNGWAKKEDVFYESTNEPVYAIRDMLTAYVAQNNGLSVEDWSDDLNNWEFVQTATFEKARAGAGKDVWQKLQNKEICVVIKKGAKGVGISKSLNYKDASTFTVNPEKTDAGCVVSE